MDTCLVSLLMLATMITSVFCPRRLCCESSPMSRMLTTFAEEATVGMGVGVNSGVGVRVGDGVAVMVLVGVMVGPEGRGVLAQVAVVVGVDDAVDVGKSVGVGVVEGVRLRAARGVGEGVEVARRAVGLGDADPGTVEVAVKEGTGLAVGLASAGETADTSVGVWAPQPVRKLEASTRQQISSSSNRLQMDSCPCSNLRYLLSIRFRIIFPHRNY